MERPRVSVIVPVRDGADVLPGCLDALADQVDVDRLEVIVVDDGSRDASVTIARRHGAVTTVRSGPPAGAYHARNAGLEVARAPVIAFTDADCQPHPTWLAAGLRALADADLVGGRIIPVSGPDPTLWARYDRAIYLDQETSIAAHHYAATANLLVRSEVFDRVGRFDARLPSSGDLEFCHRAVAAGCRLVYAADAVVAHAPRATLGATWRLHRRLGAGWAHLAHRGKRPPMWRDGAHWLPLGWVVDRVSDDGPPLRRRHVLPVHLTAMAARAVGRITAR